MLYKEQIKHPKWQKKRLEILDRDKWACQACFDTEETLHVHHKCYKPNKKIWEYDNKLLITLCKTCHEEQRSNENIYDTFLELMKEKYLVSEINTLRLGFSLMPSYHTPEIEVSIITWALTNKNIFKILEKKYFEFLEKNKKREVK